MTTQEEKILERIDNLIKGGMVEFQENGCSTRSGAWITNAGIQAYLDLENSEDCVKILDKADSLLMEYMTNLDYEMNHPIFKKAVQARILKFKRPDR